jgi:hypothetical protein
LRGVASAELLHGPAGDVTDESVDLRLSFQDRAGYARQRFAVASAVGAL